MSAQAAKGLTPICTDEMIKYNKALLFLIGSSLWIGVKFLVLEVEAVF